MASNVNPRSAEPIKGLSKRAQEMLKPKPNQISIASRADAIKQAKLKQASI